MGKSSVAELTLNEWKEIKQSADALAAVVTLFYNSPSEAEAGGLEALESIQRRLSLAVTSAANRIDGDDWECPVCGNTTPPKDSPPNEGGTNCRLSVLPLDDEAEEAKAAVQ